MASVIVFLNTRRYAFQVMAVAVVLLCIAFFMACHAGTGDQPAEDSGPVSDADSPAVVAPTDIPDAPSIPDFSLDHITASNTLAFDIELLEVRAKNWTVVHQIEDLLPKWVAAAEGTDLEEYKLVSRDLYVALGGAIWDGTNIAKETRELSDKARQLGESEAAQQLAASASEMERGLKELQQVQHEVERLRDEVIGR